MIGLPKATEFNKRIPKQKFYEHLELPAALKKILTEAVKSIYWRNKIAPATTNLAAGKEVAELEVLEIHLNSPAPPEDLLLLMDREIPYHILFLLEYQGKYQARIGYKEAAASGNRAFKVTGYYSTDWLAEEDLPLRLEGLHMDAVYENFVRQVAGSRLQRSSDEENLQESVGRDKRKQELQMQIDRLQRKIRQEKQLNRQMEINGELKKLRKEMEGLHD